MIIKGEEIFPKENILLGVMAVKKKILLPICLIVICIISFGSLSATEVHNNHLTEKGQKINANTIYHEKTIANESAIDNKMNTSYVSTNNFNTTENYSALNVTEPAKNTSEINNTNTTIKKEDKNGTNPIVNAVNETYGKLFGDNNLIKDVRKILSQLIQDKGKNNSTPPCYNPNIDDYTPKEMIHDILNC